MEAPDKICVAPHEIFDYDLDIQEVGHNGAEEYIRKDALLEWAKEQASITEKLNGKGAMLKAWNTLIDKLRSM